MENITLEALFKAGAHFGHQKRFWNPQMSPYIFGTKNNIHIIDLDKTMTLLEKSCLFIQKLASQGGQVLFVSTKRSGNESVRKHADRIQQPYVNQRWLGGTLTNYKTVRQSIRRMDTIEKQLEKPEQFHFTKKEMLLKSREVIKLKENLGGIQNMNGLPDAIFIVDTLYEHNAINEARKLGIPTIAIVDTNANPLIVDYPIPCNDDSFHAVNLIIEAIADSFQKGALLMLEKTEVEKTQGDKMQAEKVKTEERKKTKPAEQLKPPARKLAKPPVAKTVSAVKEESAEQLKLVEETAKQAETTEQEAKPIEKTEASDPVVKPTEQS